MFVLGEIKDIVCKLHEVGKVAHEAIKQMYLEARKNYISTRTRLDEIGQQLSELPKVDDINIIETRRLLEEEKRKLGDDLYRLSDKLDQLFNKDFIPEPEKAQQMEPEETQIEGFR